MLFQGKATIEMTSHCCGFSEKEKINFSVYCKNRDEVEKKIQDEYIPMGKSWHFQLGCGDDPIITITVESLVIF
jgi:hypothetical protein